MMVVVKLFAPQPDRDRRDVPALVLHFIVTVAEGVTDSVDDASRPERNPHHLDTPDHRSDEEPEQVNVESQHDENTKPIQAAEEIALDPVIRRALPVLLEHAGLADSLAIVKGALEHDVAEALDERTVRIAFTVGEGMMLPMARDPLFRHD